MIDVLQSIISFIVAIGILVTIHEYGHFWVARKMGVKVLRFSIGFGKPLWLRKGKDGTEYVIATIPLGGYVRMLGEQDDDISESDLPYAFNRKPLRARTAIVIAGPLFNLIFAVAAYWLMYTVGIPGQTPVIGSVTENSIAWQAGLELDDQILKVNDKPTPTWTVANTELLDAALKGNTIHVQVMKSSGYVRDYHLNFDDRSILLDDKGIIHNLGLSTWKPRAWLGEITPDSPADRAGLKHGDLVISADSRLINNWSEWVKYIRERPGTPIIVEVERNGSNVLTQVTPELITDEQGESFGRIGVGYHVPEEIRSQHLAEVKYGPVASLGHAVSKTWELSGLMLRMLGRMLIGDASHKNISGPITIAEYASISASLGWLEFVRFLALISISLGILNLMPIPMLDGGHLLYYVIEFVRGGPLSEKAMALGQQIGITALLLLMGLAFFNDFARLLG
jgi:regulator of sigma E protease